MDYQKDNFNEFVKDNWQELVEYAEEQTGELYDDPMGEPLLTKDGIIDEAQELWNDYWEEYKSFVEVETQDCGNK